ncbi:MAG: HD-GYP domain-containing protein [Clostridia bacterium]|nr:HD-GYP domain-containing protein [Clostridia bacterium]
MPINELYTKKVDVDNLIPGDIIANDIYLTNGALVIRNGTILSDRHIEALQRMGKRIVTIDIRNVYINAVEDSKIIMKKAEDGKNITPEEVKTAISPILREVKRERNVSRLLLELQSQDEYTFQHTINIGVISLSLAKWMGCTDNDELVRIAMAGTLHDIGKSRIPRPILRKPGKLTPGEFEIMKKHVFFGKKILEKDGTYGSDLECAILQHHERIDGTGYPYGLKGDQIHSYAKIVAVADVYHALTSKRVYKDKVNPFRVLEHLKKNIDSLDTEIVLTFIDNMLNCLLGCTVELSNGEVGKVIFTDRDKISKPLIKLEDRNEVLQLGERKDIAISDILVV